MSKGEDLNSAPRVTRRRFLQQAFAFSAAASLAGCGGNKNQAASTTQTVDTPADFLIVGDWGYDATQAPQTAVAQAMQAYVASQGITTGALLFLGDNFYGDLPGGVTSPRWQSQFEQMYPQSVFNCPAYAVPGNHDYQDAPDSKVDAELAYAQAGTSRWTMPSTYYRFTFPEENPVITFLALDSNMPNCATNPPPSDPSFYTPDASQVTAEQDWLAQMLAEPLTTPFLAVMAHHPVYSDGTWGDSATLINAWDPLLRQAGVHLYISGHDHDLEHLEFTGHPTSFCICGGGGAELRPLTTTSMGPFAQVVNGFSHLRVQQNLMTFRHLDSNGNVLHAFSKTPAGVVTIL